MLNTVSVDFHTLAEQSKVIYLQLISKQSTVAFNYFIHYTICKNEPVFTSNNNIHLQPAKY